MIGRRGLIAGGSAAAVAAAAVGLGGSALAEEDHGSSNQPNPKPPEPFPKPKKHCGLPPVKSAPKPIPGGIDSGDPNVGFIHWWLPGPDGSTTQILEIPGFGLDVDPSTITDFQGVSAFAVVAGTVRGSDGVDYDCEFDVRAMKGNYVGEDGQKRFGAFAFL
ncbi:MAG: hypothetical protein ACR2PK_12105 [Acidimicrobiales bacterium]